MFSRKIVGWSMRDTLEAELVVDALAIAVTRRRPPAGLVHHLTQGSAQAGQYTSLAFGKTLREYGLVASMGSRGDAYDTQMMPPARDIETFYNPRRRLLARLHQPRRLRDSLPKRRQERELDTIETTRAA